MGSMLFVPGDSPRKFARALTGASDALILDLEDSVAIFHRDRPVMGRRFRRGVRAAGTSPWSPTPHGSTPGVDGPS
jgi:citrate lyase subunit beta/citryl-CoA lyase